MIMYVVEVCTCYIILFCSMNPYNIKGTARATNFIQLDNCSTGRVVVARNRLSLQLKKSVGTEPGPYFSPISKR